MVDDGSLVADDECKSEVDLGVHLRSMWCFRIRLDKFWGPFWAPSGASGRDLSLRHPWHVSLTPMDGSWSPS